MSTLLLATQTAPGTPSGGQVILYAKSDKRFYSKDDAGLESPVTHAVPIAVSEGGTGLASGTSGGILGFTGTTTLASSVLLTANALLLGAGAGATPTPLGSLGTTTTVLHGAAAGPPTFGAVALADMANGTAGNLITYSAAGAPAAVATGTATQVLTSNGAGAAPTFRAVAAVAATGSVLFLAINLGAF